MTGPMMTIHLLEAVGHPAWAGVKWLVPPARQGALGMGPHLLSHCPTEAALGPLHCQRGWHRCAATCPAQHGVWEDTGQHRQELHSEGVTHISQVHWAGTSFPMPQSGNPPPETGAAFRQVQSQEGTFSQPPEQSPPLPPGPLRPLTRVSGLPSRDSSNMIMPSTRLFSVVNASALRK